MVKVEIWSDIICPFCYIGKRRLEGAAKEEGIDISVVWRSFELDPSSSKESAKPLVDMIAEKYGMTHEQAVQSQKQIAETAAGEGIAFNWEIARPGNTFDAHRVAHFAAEKGLGGVAEERFMRAYMSEGEPIGDHAAILRIAVSLGLDEGETRAVLQSDRYAEAVRRDEQIAQQHLSIRGVPYFVVDNRYAVSGAQSRDVFRQALRRASADKIVDATSTAPGDTGGMCVDGACATPTQAG